MSSKTALYRFYDADDQLLYVGITDNVSVRWRSHASTKAWWSDVNRRTMEWFDDRETALAAELKAIVTEKPTYNIQGSGGSQRPARDKGPETAWTSYMLETSNYATQSEIARRTGIGQSSIGRWYTSRPTIQNVVIFAKAYDVRPVDAIVVAGYITAEEAKVPIRPPDLSTVSTAALIARLKELLDLMGEQVSEAEDRQVVEN